MLISFLSTDLERLCSNESVAKRKLGNPGAKKLRARLADLEAAACVAHLVAGRPHSLKGDRDGQFSVDLHGGFRLVFGPASDPVPTNTDGAIDWSQVVSIQIVFIGDYHD